MQWWIWVIVAVAAYVLCLIPAIRWEKELPLTYPRKGWLWYKYWVLRVFFVPAVAALNIYKVLQGLIEKVREAQQDREAAATQAEDFARFVKVFGFEPHTPLWNEKGVLMYQIWVDDELKRLAEAMEVAFRAQVEARQNELSPRTELVNKVVAARKARFWDAHGLAVDLGFRVHETYGEYLS